MAWSSPTTNQHKVAHLVQQGESLARQQQPAAARRFFMRALALQPNHLDALLWLAALAPDPDQSIHYLQRVLDLSPQHPRAEAGLRWAKQRKLEQSRARPTWQRWLDTTLLGGAGLSIIAALVVLIWLTWQTTTMVLALYQPTPTPTVTHTPIPTATPTITPTWTPSPTPTHTPTPTVTPTPTPTLTPTPSGPTASTALGGKWIEIQLSTQTLTAYEGSTPVLTALVSTGVASLPTPIGDYAIISKVRSQAMSGPGYYLPNVEYVSYFYNGYAIHGTYWHNNFGHPMSHGCVNMTNADAKWVFEWAPLGTPVRVHW